MARVEIAFWGFWRCGLCGYETDLESKVVLGARIEIHLRTEHLIEMPRKLDAFGTVISGIHAWVF